MNFDNVALPALADIVVSQAVPAVKAAFVPSDLFNRAIAAHNANDRPLAEHLWTQVIEADPSNVSAYYNRGQIRHALGFYEDAADDFRRVLHLTPTAAAAWHKYAASLLNAHHDIAALAAIEKSIDLDPMSAEAHHCYGGILSVMNHDQAAMRAWRTAHELDPDRAETAIGQAMSLLRMSSGKDIEGWKLFETRRHKGITDLFPGMPLWRGQRAFPIKGRTILVRCEQGYGDSLHFIRYLTPLLRAGARVTLETPAPLARLVEQNYPEVSIYPCQPGVPPHHDYQTALMTLPMAFPSFADDQTAPAPYLKLCGDDQSFVDARSQPFSVGLVWHGGARPEDPDADSIDQRRSLNPTQGMWLAHELSNRCRVVSLQQDDLPKGADFYDTAIVIAGLDLVITVDTAIAHLAGAMGKPVWMLDRFSPCWRWALGSDRTHWYPSMRIFRQHTPGDWEPVMKRVLKDLEEMLA